MKKALSEHLDKLSDFIDFNFFWIIFLKYRKIVIVVPILIVLLAFLISLNLQPIYKSTATLVIEPADQKITSIEEVYSPESQFNRINNQIAILKSDEVLEYILNNEDANVKFTNLFQATPDNFIKKTFKKIFIDKSSLTTSYQKNYLKIFLKDNFDVKNIARSDVLELSFRSNNAEVGKLALTKIIESYLKYDVDSKIRVTAYANQKINSRLSELMKSMSIAENNLAKYKKERKITDIGGIKQLKIDEIKSISERMLETNKEIQINENDMISIKIAEGSVDELLAIKNLRRKKDIEAIRTNINSNENNLQSLRLIYTDDHPKVVKALDLDNSLNNQLEKILQENIQELAYELSNLKNLFDLSTQELEKAKVDLQILEEKESGMLKFAREVNLTSRLYESFLQRMKETDEAQKLQTTSVKIIKSPILPNKPIFPNILLICILAYIFSFFSLYGLLCYYELNRSVIQEPTILEALNIPVLSVLPKVDELGKGFHLFQMFLEDTKSEFSEAIRTLRTITLSKFKKHKTIVITSSFPSEGKTTIAFNLSLALAKINKTLFIETDIRRPSVLKILGESEKKLAGFSDIITGSVDFKSTLYKIPGTELDVVTSGERRTDLTDVTNTSKLKAFYKLLNNYYEYIILDTPPIQPVSDTLLLSQAADHIVLIARSQYTKMLGIRSTLKKLSNLNIKADGIILNSMDTSRSSYYGYYYYYGGYYTKGYKYA